MIRRVLAVGLAMGGSVSIAWGQTRPAETSAQLTQRVRLEWYEIDRAVTDTLLVRDLDQVLASLPAVESTSDPAVLLRCLDFAVRAGRRTQARAAIQRLAMVTDSLPRELLSNLGDFFIGRQDWVLARAFLERFPDAQPGWGYVFIKHWAEAGDASEIDGWLADRAAGDREYWFDERLRFRESLGTVGPLIESLASDLRAQPADVGRATRYVRAATNHSPRTSLDWVGSIATPRLSLDAFELGSRLLTTGRSPRGAALLFERSLAIAYTSEDQRRLETRALMTMATRVALPTTWEPALRRWATVGLIEAYTRNGQADRAQPLLERIAAEGADGIPAYGLSQLAGTVQRESGKRVIEQRITAAEAANKDSVAYWVSRAQYYTGRRERLQTIAAYDRALDLAAPERTGETARLMERYRAVTDYARFLGLPNGGGSTDGLALIWREFSAATPGSEYASWLAQTIAQQSNDIVPLTTMLRDPTAERRLWAHVAARATWAWTEEMLIRRLVEHLPRAERDDRVATAETWAATGDPTRAGALADVLLRMNDGRRAIPLIRSYIARLPDGHDRQIAQLRLFSAYLYNTTDWRSAETAFADARRSLTPGELTDHLGRLAIMAGNDGATADALRIWRMAANIDRADLRHLTAIAATPGMKASLMAYYEQLRRQDAGSWVADSALARLRTP